MEALSGTLVAGRYRVETLVGTGGSGAVWRAIQEPLGRPVALKMLRPELSENATIRRRFLREARAVAALSHPGIATIHDFGTTAEGALYLALEFVEGQSLAQLLQHEMMSIGQLLAIFDQVLAALAHAHSRGVIHRDIKPANILVGPDPEGGLRVRIVDFGIAVGHGLNWSDEGSETTGTGRVVGTPHFMAPEQARGERHLTATVDLYNVGLMMWWAITGQHAFDGPTPMDVMVAQISAPLPPFRPLPGLHPPAELEDMLRWALHKSPAERVPSAQAFRDRLRPLLQTPARATRAASEESPTLELDVQPGPRVWQEASGHTLREDNTPGAEDPDRQAGAGMLRLQIPVAGREVDQQRLMQAAHQALVRRRGLLITIEGEAGLGKSTLASWFRNALMETEGAASAQGGFHRDGERGLRGVRESLESLLQGRGLESHRLELVLTHRLESLGMHDPRDVHRLLHFLRPQLHQPGMEPGAAPPADALHDLLIRLLERMSETQPVVLLIDDLHWAGPETTGLLEFLAAEFAHRSMRVLLVVTLQPEDVESSAMVEFLGRISRLQGETVQRVRLERLDEEDARALLRSMVDAAPDLADSLLRRTGGNPMHLVQLVRYLVEEDLLVPGPQGVTPAPGVVVDDVLPPGLADIIGLRIEKVGRQRGGERVHALLDRAAVLGRSFRFSVMERMLRIENRSDLLEHVDEDVDVLLDLELLQMQETAEDDILTFPTGLIRDVIMDRLRNRRTTRRLHLWAAEAKLAIHGEESDKLAPELVVHFAAARDWARELRYARIASSIAEKGHRPHDALAYLLRCLQLLDQGGGNAPDLGFQERPLQLKAAALCMGFGRYDDAATHYRAVLAWHDVEAPQRAQARLGLAAIALAQGATEEADRIYRDTQASADAEDLLAPRIEARLGRSKVDAHRGDYEAAARLVEEASVLAREADEGRWVAETLWHQGEVERARADLAAARTSYQGALQRFEAEDMRLGVAKSHAMLAVVARMSHDLDTAEACYLAALDIYRDQGARRGMAHQFNGLGDVARFRGEHQAALAHYQRASEIFQALQLPHDTAVALTNLALVTRELSDLPSAASALRRALIVAERVGYAYLTLGIKLNLAHVLALDGLLPESDQMLAESLALADRVGLADPDFAGPLEAIAALKQARGEREEARELFLRARTMWSDLGRAAGTTRTDAPGQSSSKN